MTIEAQGNPSPQGGQGSGTPEGSQQQQEQPKFITGEELNRAITARLKDFEKAIPSKIASLLESRDAALTEQLTRVFASTLDEKLASVRAPDDPTKTKDAAPQQQAKVEDSPEFKRLQRELAALRERSELAEKKATEERAKARDVALRQAVNAELAKHEITGERAELALGVLVDSKRAITYDNQGQGDTIVFRNGDDELPLSEGLKDWAGSQQAKIFLPPRGAQGSGDGPGGRGGGGGNHDPTNPMGRLGELIAQHARR